jgi:serine/threonine protein phosphatase PrpC
MMPVRFFKMAHIDNATPLPQASLLCGDNFELINSSVRGISHISNSKVCQDATIACEQYYRGKPIILSAVSDGHGGEKYIRSDIGAHFAIISFYEVAVEFGRWIIAYQPSDEEKNREFEKRFVRKLLKRWYELIEKHYEENPLDSPIDTIATLYGCTISFVLVCEDKVFAGQIGDGAIFHYTTNQEKVFTILSDVNSNTLGLSTDSLCSSNAIYRYFCKTFPINPSSSGILLLSTDGLVDSLQENIKIALKDIYQKSQVFGKEWLRKMWGTQLAKWSYEGVGDDMGTVLMFYGKSDVSDKKIENEDETKTDENLNSNEKESREQINEKCI